LAVKNARKKCAIAKKMRNCVKAKDARVVGNGFLGNGILIASTFGIIFDRSLIRYLNIQSKTS